MCHCPTIRRPRRRISWALVLASIVLGLFAAWRIDRERQLNARLQRLEALIQEQEHEQEDSTQIETATDSNGL